jgi:DNA-binding IclR family transcriptional regulator
VQVSKITIALEILGDGKWHGIGEMLRRLELSEPKFRELTSFLNAYSFVKVDEKNGRVKISSDFKKLLTQAVT